MVPAAAAFLLSLPALFGEGVLHGAEAGFLQNGGIRLNRCAEARPSGGVERVWVGQDLNSSPKAKCQIPEFTVDDRRAYVLGSALGQRGRHQVSHKGGVAIQGSLEPVGPDIGIGARSVFQRGLELAAGFGVCQIPAAKVVGRGNIAFQFHDMGPGGCQAVGAPDDRANTRRLENAQDVLTRSSPCDGLGFKPCRQFAGEIIP